MKQYEDSTDFHNSSKVAAKYEPMWQEYYRMKYPNLKELIKTKEEKSYLQDGGVDRIVIQENLAPITYDEKTLDNVYDEIAFEYISNSVTRSPGWANKKLICDNIAYAFGPVKEIYDFNRVVIQRVWAENRKKWLASAERNERGGPHIVIKRTDVGTQFSYLSYNCAIPIYIVDQVYRELSIKMCIEPIRNCLLTKDQYYETLKAYQYNKDNEKEIALKAGANRYKEIINGK